MERKIILSVLIFSILVIYGCSSKVAKEIVKDSPTVQSQEAISWNDSLQEARYRAICEKNREYYDNVHALDQKLLRGESISPGAAIALLPKTDEEIRVLWGRSGNEEGMNRGFRHDSLCFHDVMENLSVDKICKYYVAFDCSDGFIAELYHYRCYQIWEKYPKETLKALSKIYSKKEKKFILNEFQEDED